MFIYFFTNQRIGHTGIYELPERILRFEVQITKKYYKKIKTTFEKAGKVYFYKDWIYIPNASHYGGYTGEKNKRAYEKEKKSIPLKVINSFKDKRNHIGYP